MPVLNTTVANVENAGKSPFFVLGVNTEIVAHRGGLLSGININTAPSFFRAQIDTAISANAHTLYFISFFDEILEFDVLAKTVVAKF